jgi:hypothetical protein
MPSLFGTDVAVNPQLRNVSRSFNGKTVREYEVTFPADVSGSTGPDGVLRRTFDVLALRATPILISKTYTDGTEIKVFVEGDFPDDDYNGTGSDVSFATFLQTELQALGSVDSIDLSTTTVEENTMTGPFFADDVEADYAS